MTINAFPSKESKPINERVGQNVRLFAQMRGIPQVQLAVTLGVDQSSMSRRIKGATDWAPDEMQKVANLLGVKIWRLFDELPDLDSNQEPAGSELGPNSPVVYLSDYQTEKLDAHQATNTNTTSLALSISR